MSYRDKLNKAFAKPATAPLSALRSDLSNLCSLDAEKSSDTHISEQRYLSQPAPNAIVWAASPEFLSLMNKEGKPAVYDYPRTYQIIRDVFQLRCPVCNPGGFIHIPNPVTVSSAGHPADCWGKGQEYLESEALLEWNAEYQDDMCPKCRTLRAEFEQDELLEKVNQLHLVCGMRSGKSVTAGSYLGTYVEHRLITLGMNNPEGLHGALGLPLKDMFEMTFLASTDTQSKDTIWAKYRAARTNSAWFKRYVPWVTEEEKLQETPPGMLPWSYTENAKRIENGHLKLTITSLNSNSAGLAGRTRVAGFIDEIGRMLQTDSRMAADEIYRTIDASMQTVRTRAKLASAPRWLGFTCSVTSPLAQHDKAMELLKASPETPGMLAYHYATWDFNPYETRDMFDAAYAKDPVGAERDFGANPPTAAHPFIYDKPRFRDSVIKIGNMPLAMFSQYVISDPNGMNYLALRYEDAKLVRDYPRVIVFDAGKNFDAFAGTCAHGEWRDTPDGRRLVTVFDFHIRLVPFEGGEIFFDSIPEVLRHLRDKIVLTRAEFDRWNSVQIIQQIRMLGINAAQVSTADADYRKFRQDAMSGLVEMLPIPDGELREDGTWRNDPPMMSPAAAVIYELEGLEEDPNTGKVWNPRKGERRGYNSNDLAQTAVHAHKLIQETGYSKRQTDNSAEMRLRRGEAMTTMNMGTILRTSGMSQRRW